MFFPHVPRFSLGFAHPFRVDHGWASPRRQVDHEAPHALRGGGAPVPGHAAAQVVGVQVLSWKNLMGKKVVGDNSYIMLYLYKSDIVIGILILIYSDIGILDITI